MKAQKTLTRQLYIVGTEAVMEAVLTILLSIRGWSDDSWNNKHFSSYQYSQLGPTAPHAHYFRSTSPLPTYLLIQHYDAATVLPTTHIAYDSHLQTTSSPFTHSSTHQLVSLSIQKKDLEKKNTLSCRCVNLLLSYYLIFFLCFEIAVNLLK